MEPQLKTTIQSKVLDLALVELVLSKRDAFQPLWTIDSWAKFLIWMALNCGLAGERKDLELFANALGNSLTSKMRRIFFERRLEDLSLCVMADPSESAVLVMPLIGGGVVTKTNASEALEMIALKGRVALDIDLWEMRDSMIVIPWQLEESDS